MNSTLPLLESSSHYPGETAIRIDSYPAGGVFVALTQAYLTRAARITFSTTPDQFSGPYSAAPLGTANLLGSGLYPDTSVLRHWLPAHPCYQPGCALKPNGVSNRRCTRRLRGRNDLSGQLSVRHAFNMTRGRTAYRSLSDTDGDRFTPKTSMPCCYTIVIPPGLNSLLAHGYFHDSKYNQPWSSIHLSLASDRKSPGFYRAKHG